MITYIQGVIAKLVRLQNGQSFWGLVLFDARRSRHCCIFKWTQNKVAHKLKVITFVALKLACLMYGPHEECRVPLAKALGAAGKRYQKMLWNKQNHA